MGKTCQIQGSSLCPSGYQECGPVSNKHLITLMGFSFMYSRGETNLNANLPLHCRFHKVNFLTPVWWSSTVLVAKGILLCKSLLCVRHCSKSFLYAASYLILWGIYYHISSYWWKTQEGMLRTCSQSQQKSNVTRATIWIQANFRTGLF